MSCAPQILIQQAERYERMAKDFPRGSGARIAAATTARCTREAIAWYEEQQPVGSIPRESGKTLAPWV